MTEPTVDVVVSTSVVLCDVQEATGQVRQLLDEAGEQLGTLLHDLRETGSDE